MITLRVQYLDENNSTSLAVMRRFVPWSEGCSALPVNAEFMRQLRFDRIVSACDVETGELVDVRELCGAPPLPGPITPRSRRQPRPTAKGRGNSSEAFKGQRRVDRDEFRMRYRYDVIENHFINRLIGEFGGRCFACDSPETLQLDHHIPLLHGGRRVPGNIVILCHRCNARKRDQLPDEFYSAEELRALAQLLARQDEILAFEFDEARWNSEPAKYLIDIGISPLLVHEVMTNEDHPWHLLLEPAPELGVRLCVGPEELAAMIRRAEAER